MRPALTKKWPKIITGILLASMLSFLSSQGLVQAQPLPFDRPFFRILGADVFAGGWFNSKTTACSTDPANNYQAPTYSPPSGQHKGAILAYTDWKKNQMDSKGASSEYGAIALGLIEGLSVTGPGDEPYGFYSGGLSYNEVSFANESTLEDTKYWGGFFEGSTPQTHCIPDYFGTKQENPTASSGNISDVSGLGSGQYLYKPDGIMTISSPGEIGQSRHITIFVDGNVYISSDIKYTSRENYTADTAPKLALVVRGNIYVSPNVSRLDGFYVAQPDDTDAASIATSGVFWSCHDNSNDLSVQGAWLGDNCRRNRLTINGALVAKQVNLTRISGDYRNKNDIAEVINYTPEMVVGGPFFSSGSDDSTAEIQSLVNLPPVF